ncbi:MAG TPA: DUF2341 domain-containing protein [Fibrobacteria bacterium]|nr:DUF2341 domain-containing protein [Fibrobacteria bacterium]
MSPARKRGSGPGRILRLSLCACAAFPWACFRSGGDDPDLQGPGSETVGLAGSAEYAGGRPAAQVQVIARPISYLADTAERASHTLPGGMTAANAAGGYRIAPVQPDSYAVEVRGDSGRAALVAVTVDSGLAAAPKAVLKPVGGIRGRVRRLHASKASVFVRVFGMDRLAYVGPDSSAFAFPDLPEGRYRVQAMSPDPALGSITVRDMEVRSGEVRDIGEVLLDAFSNEDYAAWARSEAVAIRTGPAGAGLTEGVRAFPLALRLDATSFPFDSAAADGSDIRFADASGRHLPYEIRGWDAAAKRAMIWVRVDSLRPGDDTQSIRIFWKRANAPDLSDGRAVFDTADGWRGEWHLDGQAPAGKFPDASPLGNALVASSDSAVSAAMVSDLGGAAAFPGKGLLSSSDSMRAPQVFTLSLWFRTRSPGKLIGFESSYMDMKAGAYDRHLWIEPDGSVHFGVYIADPPEGRTSFERIAASPPGFADDNWHHVAAVQDPQTGMSLYLDGALAAVNAEAIHAEDIGGWWILGGGTLAQWSAAIKGDTHLKGALDEAGVAHVRRSAAWIKLAYETQKTGSTVVLFHSP